MTRPETITNQLECLRVTQAEPAGHESGDYITPEKLDVFQIPPDSCLVLYDVSTRKALFYRKTGTGYHRFLIRNKRANPINIRPNDYVLTIDYAKNIIPGDIRNVFRRGT